MIFQQILLQIFHKLNKERTISAAYHLLRGKRSGQTIQDVGIFKLHDFFGLLPKLSRENFDAEVAKLVDANFLHIEENGFYTMTELGNQQVSHTQSFNFDGWHYRGNEHVFFARFTLVVQSLSHHKSGRMSFSPVIKDEGIHKWVRSFLLWCSYQSGGVGQQLFDEVTASLKEAPLTDGVRTMILYRLSGDGMPGRTWQQLAHEQNIEQIDVQLQFIEGLHIWLNTIIATSDYLLLNKLAEGIRVEVVLTGSANQTAQLFNKGYSIEQMSFMRNLKVSTIEDHLVELAMNDAGFPIEQFVSLDDVKQVFEQAKMLETKKLRVLHEVMDHLSYFQLRLILAKGED